MAAKRHTRWSIAGWTLLLAWSACVPSPPEAPREGADAGAADAQPSDAAGPADATGGGSPDASGQIDGSRPYPWEPLVRVRGPARLDEADEVDLEVTIMRSRFGPEDRVDADAFEVSSSTTVRVDGAQLLALGPGQAEVVAIVDDHRSAPLRIVVEPVGELRGVWVSRWQWSDTDDLQAIVDDAADANLNALFFQVRGEADAFYASSIEPWSRILSGTLGTDPGWDPLAELVTRAHARGLEVHAWLNTFTAWQSMTPPTASAPTHPLNAHPDWLCADDQGTPMAPGDASYQFFSPGNPAVRDHIASVVEDLVDGYALDGVHFDYVRYPGPQYCHDAASLSAYDAARSNDPALDYGDFQRANVGALLEDVRARLSANGDDVILTAATWGVYRNRWGWSSVSKGYDDYFQDGHAFIERGALDAIVPMTYWALTETPGDRLDFATLTADHVAAASRGGRYSYAGIETSHGADEIIRQVEAARALGARGMVFFEIQGLRDAGALTMLKDGVFAEDAAVPPYAFRR